MHYLQDKAFLKQLDKIKNKITFVRITALNLQDLPIEQIEGYVTQGSINVDGSSAIRRTCSLTITAREDKFKFSDYYWGFNTKFKLEIGLENKINNKYPSTIWFQQGIFIITSFSVSRTTNNLTINLQGKDKMCLLNGDIGGCLESQVDFGKIDEIDKDGHKISKKNLIVDIIKNLLIHYGQEQEQNIIINDLDNYGLELLEYRGNDPLYLFRQGDQNTNDKFLTATYQGDMVCEVRSPQYDEKNDVNHTQSILLKNLDNNIWGTTYDSISEGLLGKSKTIAKIVNLEGNEENSLIEPYQVVKIKYGQTIGFKISDLIYAGDLIANAGETLTSVLDKIKNMLGDFEYFYDIKGRFVFQKKPSSYQRNWSNKYEEKNSKLEEKFLEKLEQSKSNTYNLDGTELVTAFNNTPNINNIKNDFSIWGQRPSVTGTNLSIHLRYAIDKKPISYKTITVKNDDEEFIKYKEKYQLNLLPQNSFIFNASSTENGIQEGLGTNDELMALNCDWRELIFRMANDYLKYGFLSDFKQRVYEANPQYVNGITGYEQYYTDIQGFWRQLYNPNYFKYNNKSLYEWIYPEAEQKYEETIEGINHPKENYQLPMYINNTFFKINPQFDYWSKSIIETPETINFWFNFIDENIELDKYSVQSVGRRSKVINDTNIKSIFYEGTPTIIFVDDIRKYSKISSGDYSYIQLPDEVELFSVSARGQSAMDKLDNLLYQHTYCTESASITTLPIYHLQPNTRININDNILGVSGDYIVTKFTLQLSNSGTMQITANKAIENSYYQ